MAGQRIMLDTEVVRLDDATVLCSWRDVTELVESETLLSHAYEETAEMRATLQTALDATSDGFAIYQLEWDDTMSLAGMRVVHANAAGAASLGLDAESMIGMELHEFFPEVALTGLVFVDLDRFKAGNDTYGHAAGDAVLKASAHRLGQMVRHGDLAARLAGDEFVLVLTGLSADWDPGHFFARAGDQLAEAVFAEGVELRPSASLGVVLADPRHEAVDVDDLVKRADAEMYKAKAASRR